ncbi:hypothetical protein SAMN05444360_12182 [Chryseobacterium carnipullorum]|nr:hypothetical protein SAMN05444360_12182 [Chryseobacterium carnipullorum]
MNENKLKMKRLTKIILIISVIYTALFLYFQYDYFFKLSPIVVFLLIINFYMIYKYDSKVLNYIYNVLLIVFLIICFSFGAILRQDW